MYKKIFFGKFIGIEIRFVRSEEAGRIEMWEGNHTCTFGGSVDLQEADIERMSDEEIFKPISDSKISPSSLVQMCDAVNNLCIFGRRKARDLAEGIFPLCNEWLTRLIQTPLVPILSVGRVKFFGRHVWRARQASKMTAAFFSRDRRPRRSVLIRGEAAVVHA